MNALPLLAIAIMWAFLAKDGLNKRRVIVATIASVVIVALALSWGILGPLVGHIAFHMQIGG